MSEYFKYFPTIPHDIKNEGRQVNLTNVLKRFRVRSDLQDKTDIFYMYDVQDGDRPDVIADKYYNDPKLAWIVLHFNNIVDPLFDWPLFGRDFDKYIAAKYGSIINAQNTVHEYRQVLVEKAVLYDGSIRPEKIIKIDKTTYDSLVGDPNRQSVSKYDWEVEQNEKKRKIKILDKKYIGKVTDEVKYILKDTE